MRETFSRSVPLTLVVLAACGGSGGGTQTVAPIDTTSRPTAAQYVNPVLDADFPDPAVMRASDGFYYAYATQTTGVRLQVKEALSQGQEVTLTLESIRTRRVVRCVGTVAWSVQAADGAWCVGVQLHKHLSYPDLTALSRM